VYCAASFSLTATLSTLCSCFSFLLSFYLPFIPTLRFPELGSPSVVASSTTVVAFLPVDFPDYALLQPTWRWFDEANTFLKKILTIRYGARAMRNVRMMY
jgi:hypothetical protein